MGIAISTIIIILYGNTNLYHNYVIVNQGISINGGTPIVGWLIMENPCIRMIPVSYNLPIYMEISISIVDSYKINQGI